MNTKVGVQAQVPHDAGFNDPLPVFAFVNQLVQQEIASALRQDERREVAVPVVIERREDIAA